MDYVLDTGGQVHSSIIIIEEVPPAPPRTSCDMFSLLQISGRGRYEGEAGERK